MSVILIILAFLWGVATTSWYWAKKCFEREIEYSKKLDTHQRKLIDILIGEEK